MPKSKPAKIGIWGDTQAVIADHLKYMRARLDAWERRYPYAVRFVEEEARAEIEGREPNYPPSISIG